MINLIPRFRGAFYLVLYAMDDYIVILFVANKRLLIR